MALLVASFYDCLLGGEDGGYLKLNRRLLEARGYLVMQVRYDFFPPKSTVVTRTKMLLSKLQELLK